MLHVICWNLLWDWITVSLTMLDKLALATAFMPIAVSNFFLYVSWVFNEWTMSEIVDFKPSGVQCSKWISPLVAVPNRVFKTVPAKLIKPHLWSILVKSCWKLWSLTSNVYSKVVIWFNSGFLVSSLLCPSSKIRSAVILATASLSKTLHCGLVAV